MRITQLTENLTQITRLRFVNAYLVREDDGLTLVDTTVPGATEDLMEAARRAGAEIRRIALTHGHGDHIGSLDMLVERLGPEVEVLIPGLDQRVLDGERTWDGRKVKGSWPDVRTRPGTLLHPGHRVGSLEVLAAPGHTPGQVAFLDTRDRSLIAGDAFKTLGGLEPPSRFSLPFPFAYLATWSPEQAVASARELAEAQPSLLAVGHGAALRDPAGAMTTAVRRAGG